MSNAQTITHAEVFADEFTGRIFANVGWKSPTGRTTNLRTVRSVELAADTTAADLRKSKGLADSVEINFVQVAS